MKKQFMVCMLFGILFVGLSLIPAVGADDSYLESIETSSPPSYELISKVEIPVLYVYDDNPGPLDTYENYPIWVYGRLFGAWWYSSINVKIYVQALYHVDSFRYSVPTGFQEYWADAPFGLFKWNGDYDFTTGASAQVTGTTSFSGGNQNYQMGLSASVTGNPTGYYHEENNEYGTDVGDWRYMGSFESRYSNLYASQEFSALLQLHFIHSVAEDYYEGVYWTNGRYSRITYVEDFRFKLVFDFYGGASGPYLTNHTHIMGNNVPSGESLFALLFFNLISF